MKVSMRIDALRGQMKKEGIDLYIVPSDDFHQSEYVGEYFKEREFITGFTGSAGTAVITADKAGLWTDGRYFIQAENQLAGSGVSLYKMGEPDTDTIEDFIKKELPYGGTVGFDGRTVGTAAGNSYAEAAIEKNGSVNGQYDLVGRIWTDRPKLPSDKAYFLEEKYTGESSESKMARVREKMKKYGADIHLLASLDDIAWLLNMRGNDIAYCPLVLGYFILYKNRAELYADQTKFSDAARIRLKNLGVTLRGYDEIISGLEHLPEGSHVLLDADRVSYTLYHSIPSEAEILEYENPEILMKSIKNDIEIANIRNAHYKDGVAHTKFMYWLKHITENDHITEISASGKLEEFRALQEDYLGPSFAPISAYGEHGAIVHYSAVPDTDAELKPGKFLLTDTGGHYKDGSTDITRTVAIGNVSMREKEDFTLTLRAMLRLMNTVFLYGCSGANLDLAAREVFWKEHLNFNHGTGHGVGYLMNIHEPPISFRWKEGKIPAPALEKNMVITDEPGIYIQDSHGIRIENELLVCEDIKNEYGQFMHFEPLTFVPIDLDAVLPEKMTEEERHMLNIYHAKVYELNAPYMDPEEKEWLKEYTRPI